MMRCSCNAPSPCTPSCSHPVQSANIDALEQSELVEATGEGLVDLHRESLGHLRPAAGQVPAR
ncbi:exported hypothetical protein [Cupriavidus taiwanensis]|nr:exported hypothetical protein [Cupriavidus taiwanensis]SOZ32407.1 exported hypothetical protein [Cupriavidus taiwanensis]SOZ47998.1 exported hypothetical protein [Cupriavidus taiwanensis]